MFTLILLLVDEYYKENESDRITKEACDLSTISHSLVVRGSNDMALANGQPKKLPMLVTM